MNTLDEFNPAKNALELETKGTLKCLATPPPSGLQLSKPVASQQVVPSITLPIEHLIEIVTCPGEVRGSATGWCGSARISERTAALLNHAGATFKSLYVIEGPLVDQWGLTYFLLWHRAEYEDTQAQRRAKAAEWEATREKNAIKYNMLTNVVNSVFRVFQKTQGVSVAKRSDAENFVKLCLECKDEPSLTLLAKHGFDINIYNQ